MKLLKFLMLQFIVAFLVICLTDGARNSQADEWNRGFANFSFDLYEQCAQAQNVIVSPLSVAMALSLLSQAANGTTFDQLSSVLYLNNDKTIVAKQFHDYFESIRNNTGNSELIVTNQIYVQQEIQLNKSIQDVATEKFFSSIRSVDFKRANDTSQTINSFVKNSTEGKIAEIVTPKQLDGQYRVILINAIHFNSSFFRPFWNNPERKMRFNNGPNVNDTVFPYAMRVRGWFPIAYLADLGGHAVQLKYGESSLSLIIIYHVKVPFLELEQRIRNYTLFRVINQMRIFNCEVKIPRFTIETELDLTDILKNMGISEIFTDHADLGGLSNTNEKIKVDKVIHKAYFDVGGYEGLPKTRFTRRNHPNIRFEAFRPFLYYIWDELTNTTIISGRITHFPKADEK